MRGERERSGNVNSRRAASSGEEKSRRTLFLVFQSTKLLASAPTLASSFGILCIPALSSTNSLPSSSLSRRSLRSAIAEMSSAQ